MTPTQTTLFSEGTMSQAPTAEISPVDASTDFREVRKRHPDEPAPFSLKPRIGTNQCVCMGCGEGFSSITTFDMHQRIGLDGRPVCLHPSALTAKDGTPKPMVRNARGWWISRAREIAS